MRLGKPAYQRLINFRLSAAHQYLVVDYSIDCESARYDEYYVIAWLGAIVYALVIPLGMLVLVYMDRDVLRKPIEERTTEETARVAKSKFLWGSYSPHAYWDCGVDARLPPSVAAHTYQPLRLTSTSSWTAIAD